MCPFLRLLKNSFFGKKWHIFWKLKFSLLCDSCIVVNLVWEAEHKSLRSKSDFHLICVVHPPYVLAQLLRVRPCRITINNQHVVKRKLAWVAFLHHLIERFLKIFRDENSTLSWDITFVKRRWFWAQILKEETRFLQLIISRKNIFELILT